MTGDFRAKIGTHVDLKPDRSHVVLVAIIVLAAICLVSGFLFLWHKPHLSWVPLSLAVVLLAFVAKCWFASRRDLDFHGAATTQFIDTHGNQLTTDTRALGSPDLLHGIERIVSQLTHREPLPDPDGLVDDRGNPIPESQSDAREKVADANRTAQEFADSATSLMSSHDPQNGGISLGARQASSESILQNRAAEATDSDGYSESE